MQYFLPEIGRIDCKTCREQKGNQQRIRFIEGTSQGLAAEDDSFLRGLPSILSAKAVHVTAGISIGR
jgi:hypothetical protein